MAKISGKDMESFRGLICAYVARGSNWADGEPKRPEQIESRLMAWEIAHRSGAASYCYGDASRDIPGIPGCEDSHIQTALKAIFSKAGF